MLVVFFIFCFSVAINFIPGLDLVKSLLLALILSVLYLRQAQGRTREEDGDRYLRLCGERYPIRLTEDTYLMSNLLVGGDLPWAWVLWTEKYFGLKLKEATGKYLHLLDSFCSFGDKMGEAIVRASYVIATMVQKGNLEARLGVWCENHRAALGEEFRKGCFWKKLEVGDVLPYGIFQCSPTANFLATIYTVKFAETKLSWLGTQKTAVKEVKSARICFRNDGEWEKNAALVFEIYPELDPKNLGSGPNKYGVFIQESVDVDWESFRSRLPKLVEKLGVKK